MRKIPTLYARTEDRRYVIDQVTPGCEWVLAGEGVATRKYDGTCVMWDGTQWWARREVKPGRPTPEGFVLSDVDETTGKIVGWEPAGQTGFWKYLAEAAASLPPADVGTYELCGPKINGNPEQFEEHALVEHAHTEVLRASPRQFDELHGYLASSPWEGIVWHHPDGRMAKLKKRDFPAARP